MFVLLLFIALGALSVFGAAGETAFTVVMVAANVLCWIPVCRVVLRQMVEEAGR